jgi:hypothetical protein
VEWFGYGIKDEPVRLSGGRLLTCTLQAPIGEAWNMRKQDRMANQQQNPPQQPPDKQSKPELRERERVKGSASQNQPVRPQRQPGKLPLPD